MFVLTEGGRLLSLIKRGVPDKEFFDGAWREPRSPLYVFEFSEDVHHLDDKEVEELIESGRFN